MSAMRRLRALVDLLLHRRAVEDDLDAEVASWYEISADRDAAGSGDREAAKRAARVAAGGPEQVKELVRAGRPGAGLEAAWRDARYAARTLRKSPWFTAIAIATLALGIGANGAIFSLVDALLLRTLPVPEPQRLVLLTDPGAGGMATETREHGERSLLAYAEFDALRAGAGALSAVAAAQSFLSTVDLETGRNGGDGDVARMQLVSGEFFGVLGVSPALGRLFGPPDDLPSADPAGVISFGFWRRAFGGDVSVLGRTLRVGEARVHIVGVAPPGFQGILAGSSPDLWLPISLQPQALPGRDLLRPHDTLWLQVIGRLAPGISMQQAEAALNVTFRGFVERDAAPAAGAEERANKLDQRLRLTSGATGASPLRDRFSDPLLLLFAMVVLVLLILCANLANLTLARAERRRREIGICMALGGGRVRLVRQLLVESLLIAGASGVLGLALSIGGAHLLVARVSEGVGAVALDVQGSTRVLLFTAGLALLTSLLFGLIPALRATRLDVARALSGSRGGIGTRGAARTARLLVSAQVALSLALLVGAALLVTSLTRLLGQPLGFERERLLAVRLNPAAAGYGDERLPSLYGQVRSTLERLPGVRAVSVSNVGLFGADSGDPISVDGGLPASVPDAHARWTSVGAGYFSTLGVALLRGREIDGADERSGRPVCLVNETFARTFVPGADPIGRLVTDEYATTRETFEVIGLVPDLREHQPQEAPRPRFYPNLAHPIGTVAAPTFLLRSAGEPKTLTLAVRRALKELDAGLPVLDVRTGDELIGRRVFAERLIAELSGFFGVVGILLSALGLYGVMSYSIGRRTAEFGLRMAVGASRGRLVRLVLGETLAVVAVGVAAGLTVALSAGRLLASRLYGIAPWDPATLLAATLLLTGVALAAGYLPARRAARAEPLQALRSD